MAAHQSSPRCGSEPQLLDKCRHVGPDLSGRVFLPGTQCGSVRSASANRSHPPSTAIERPSLTASRSHLDGLGPSCASLQSSCIIGSPSLLTKTSSPLPPGIIWVQVSAAMFIRAEHLGPTMQMLFPLSKILGSLVARSPSGRSLFSVTINFTWGSRVPLTTRSRPRGPCLPPPLAHSMSAGSRIYSLT